MTNLEIAKSMRDAAQYLRANGWSQGGYGRHGGARCAAGALISVLGDQSEEDWCDERVVRPSVDALHDALGAKAPIADWNDTPGRTAAEVIDLFESVALQHELRALAGTIGERVGEPATAGEVTNPESHPGGGVDHRAPGPLALQVPANA